MATFISIIMRGLCKGESLKDQVAAHQRAPQNSELRNGQVHLLVLLKVQHISNNGQIHLFSFSRGSISQTMVNLTFSSQRHLGPGNQGPASG